MKQKVIILKGLPASGKTTFAKEFVSKNKGWVRVNKDDIRAMLGFEFNHSNEEFTCDVRNALIEDALLNGKSVIVDDTNFNPVHERNIRSLVEELEVELGEVDFEVKVIDTPIWDCIERDAKREKSVGHKVIWGMYNKYLADNKSKSEWKPEGKTPAIIVDIDSTLAHIKNRNPHDYTKVNEDYVDVVIRDIVKRYYQSGIKVLIVSGRKDICREETIKWLDDNMIPFHALYMRKGDDSRKDCIVKEEIYHQEIEPKCKVFMVLDDRTQVVRMWRSLGLKCLECEYSSF